MKIPTKQAVIDYFILKGYKPEVGKAFWDYYNDGDWHDKYGVKVRNWKQKCRGARWFVKENEVGNEKTSGHSTKLGRAKAAIQRNRDANLSGIRGVNARNVV